MEVVHQRRNTSKKFLKIDFGKKKKKNEEKWKKEKEKERNMIEESS